VVVAVGETEVDPEAPAEVNETGEILIEVAPLPVQDKVAAWPEVIELGVAVKEVIVGAEGLATVIESTWLALFGPAVTARVNEYVPAVAVDPVIAPVLLLSDSPAGRAPELIEKVGEVQPEIPIAWLYAAPVCTPGNEVVVTEQGTGESERLTVYALPPALFTRTNALLAAEYANLP
jgi:hypothetical protein